MSQSSTTTRRTAKITETTSTALPALPTESATKLPATTKPAAKKRGFVAVKVDYVSAKTQLVPCTANKDMHIEGEHGASVDLKAGEKFYLARAASLAENMFYIVREAYGAKKCSCPAAKPCKHEIAVAAAITAKEVARKMAKWAKKPAVIAPPAPQVVESSVPPVSIEEPVAPLVPEEDAALMAQAVKIVEVDDAPGTLHSAVRGGFLDACFGTSPEAAQYRKACQEQRSAAS